ncbi:polyadenylate-binding protein-interacting protein 2B isoform X2 [Patagioenas fasciata]|uniref:polyadenylate-binding protein-interacting protein 2B isoform X2 n=1 Tax=Patagioenas fasciata TaxID=372321 RepID=UPI003A997877
MGGRHCPHAVPGLFPPVKQELALPWQPRFECSRGTVRRDPPDHPSLHRGRARTAPVPELASHPGVNLIYTRVVSSRNPGWKAALPGARSAPALTGRALAGFGGRESRDRGTGARAGEVEEPRGRIAAFALVLLASLHFACRAGVQPKVAPFPRRKHGERRSCGSGGPCQSAGVAAALTVPSNCSAVSLCPSPLTPVSLCGAHSVSVGPGIMVLCLSVPPPCPCAELAVCPWDQQLQCCVRLSLPSVPVWSSQCVCGTSSCSAVSVCPSPVSLCGAHSVSVGPAAAVPCPSVAPRCPQVSLCRAHGVSVGPGVTMCPWAQQLPVSPPRAEAAARGAGSFCLMDAPF